MSYLGLNTTTDDHAAKASPADVRRKNRQLIFRLLFPTNQYSRAELGRRTGLSRVAVSDVVGRMLEEGLLRETGQAPSGGKGKRGRSTCCTAQSPICSASRCVTPKSP